MHYDRYGRLQYLIDYYYSDGPDEVSFALGRTIQSVMQRATDLRKQGRLTAPAVRTWHKRTRTA